MARDKAWEQLEDYTAQRLKELDPYCRHSKASGGNCGENGDIYFSKNIGVHFEMKQRNTESVTIKKDVWEKLNSEIPLGVQKIPVLALENKDKKRWAVLDLDDFINIYIEWYKLKNGEKYAKT